MANVRADQVLVDGNVINVKPISGAIRTSNANVSRFFEDFLKILYLLIFIILQFQLAIVTCTDRSQINAIVKPDSANV
jgi:hypothetical protein